MTCIKCPSCKLQLNVSVYPFYCSCGGIWKSKEEVEVVSETDIVKEKKVGESLTPAARKKSRIRTQSELDELIATFCEECEWYTIAEVCSADVGCQQCREKSKWRARAIHVSYQCPKGKWTQTWSGFVEEEQPKHRSRKGAVRVGFLTPTLKSAGAERWVDTMIRSFDERIVRTVGVLLMSKSAKKEEPMAVALADRYPVLTISDDLSPLIGADVLIVWGIGRLQRELDVYPGLTVYVSHTSTEAGRLMNGKAVQSMDYFVAVSQKSADFFPKNTRCTVLHNGIDLRRLNSSVSRKETRSSWGVKDGQCAVGFVGRPHPDKHPELVAQACNLLDENYVPVFVGEFDHRIRSELESYCDRSLFLGHVDQVGDVYNALDVFVLPSDHEAMNLALCEVWASGVPAVATPVGAVAELEEMFNKQLVVRIPIAGSAEQLADAIVKAHYGDHDKLLETRWIARQHFSSDAMARRWTSYLLAITRWEGGL